MKCGSRSRCLSLFLILSVYTLSDGVIFGWVFDCVCVMFGVCILYLFRSFGMSSVCICDIVAVHSCYAIHTRAPLIIHHIFNDMLVGYLRMYECAILYSKRALLLKCLLSTWAQMPRYSLQTHYHISSFSLHSKHPNRQNWPSIGTQQ